MTIKMPNLPEAVKPAFIGFNTEFMQAYESRPRMWLTDDMISIVNAGPEMLTARFPIPLNQAGYKRHEGEIRYRELSARYTDVGFEEWSDGVEEKLDTLMAIGSWIGWGDQPRLMAQAAWLLEQQVVASALEANAVLDWLGVTFFNAALPVNVITGLGGTQSNILTAMTPSAANFDRISHAFRTMKGPDGQYLGLEWIGILTPPDLETAIENILAPLTSGAVMQFTSGTEDPHRYRGKKWFRQVPEFTDQTVYYAIGMSPRSVKPFAGMRKLAPASVNVMTGQVTMSGSDVETFIHDKDHPKYENTGRVGIGKKKRFGALPILPTHIIRCEV